MGQFKFPTLPYMRRILFLIVVSSLFFWMQSCTCCVYYNHMFNAERAWNEALALKKSRQDSTPNDTTWVTLNERAKFDRVIEKCSRVLERFPEDVDSKPRAVYLIAESFRGKGEWSKAITKYDEFERYFSDHDSMPAVEYQRAFSLYKNRDFAIAHFAVDRMLAKGDSFPFYAEALQLKSYLNENSNLPEEAIAALEKILATGTGTPFMRGRMHLRLAELYFKIEKWQNSLDHYLATEILELDQRDQLAATLGAVECFVNLGQYGKAIELLLVEEMEPDNARRLYDYQIRRGEILLLAKKGDQGLALLREIAVKNPKSVFAVRAWYGMGDFEQMIRKNYPKAVEHYDSAWASWSSSEWGRMAKSRRDALSQVLALQKKMGADSKPTTLTPKEEFQIAELFLFKLSEVDSAISTLDRLVSDTANQAMRDPEVLARAYYARAFIYDEFKKDSLKGDSLYRDVVSKFPGTDFAKQAQLNLGIRVTEKNTEDLAHDAFLKAESIWVSIQSVPVDSMERIDTLFAQAIRAYDTVVVLYPKTRHAARALWAKGWILENQAGEMDSARVAYDKLRKEYGHTPWGKEAVEKLQPRIKVTDQEVDRLKKRLEQSEETFDRARKQYEEDMRKKQEAERKKLLDGPTVDEVLENDYNTLYDFQ